MSYDRISLNTHEQDAMALLAVQNPARFQQIRTKTLLRLAGSWGDTPSEAISEVLADMEKKGISPKQKEELLKLKNQLITGKITPYDAVGAFKNMLGQGINKKAASQQKRGYTSREMTQHWTKLAMACALIKPNPGMLLPADYNAEKEYVDKAVIPKINHLQATLNGPAKGNYYETRPHLKDSTINNPNWAEILGNLPKGSRGCALTLMQGCPENPRFAESARELAWPKQEAPAEAENQRLNRFLQSLPARPKGRNKFVLSRQAIMSIPPSSLELPPITPPNQKELKVGAAVQAELTNAMGQPPSELQLQEIRTNTFRKLAYLHPQIQTKIKEELNDYLDANESKYTQKITFNTLKWMLGKGTKEHVPIHINYKQEATAELTEALLVNATQRNTTQSDNRRVASLLRQNFREEKIQPMGATNTVIREWLDKKYDQTTNPKPISTEVTITSRDTEVKETKVEETPPIPKEPMVGWFTAITIWDELKAKKTKKKQGQIGPHCDLVISATTGTPIDTSKKYGENDYTILHVAAWWKSAGMLEETIHAAKNKTHPTFPKTKEGNNPAHRCKSAAHAEVLVRNNAPIRDANTNNATPLEQSSDLVVVEARYKREKKAAELIRNTDSIEI